MKKLILFLIIIFAGLSAFGQLDTTNIGTGANTGTGESIRSAFLKVNRTIRQVNTNTDSLKLKLNKIDTLSLSNRIDAMSSMTYPASGIALSTGSAWGSSITNNSTNWNTAYTDRLKWDGGSTGLTAATGRTSLGGTTVGQALFTLSNPSAITFLRINADNSVTALSAANFKTALSLAASDVGLGNVTNESKATMFTSPSFTTQVTLPATTYIPNGGALNFNSGDVTLTHGSNVVTLAVGDLALGANNITMTGSIAATGNRVTKGWFAKLEITNLPTVNGGTLKTALSLTASDVGLGNVTNESKATMFTNPTFTGVQKVSTTDTLATRAYARSVSGSGGAYLEVADTSTMLNKYARKASPTFTGVVTIPEGFYLGGSTMNASAAELNVLNGIAGGLTATELSYMDGVTEAVQDQIDSLWTEVNDTLSGSSIYQMLNDTIPIVTFSLGAGLPADTACFNNNVLAGSFFNGGSDTLVVKKLVGILKEGTGTETIAVQVAWHTTFLSASATLLNSSALTVNSITTGTVDTSFANAKIPPNVFVWCILSGASKDNKPTFMNVTLSGNKIPKY